MAIPTVDLIAFRILVEAMKTGHVAVRECTLRGTTNTATLLCIVQEEGGEEISFLPVAILRSGLTQMFDPPTEADARATVAHPNYPHGVEEGLVPNPPFMAQ